MFTSVRFMCDISKTTKHVLTKADRKLRRGQRSLRAYKKNVFLKRFPVKFDGISPMDGASLKFFCH